MDKLRKTSLRRTLTSLMLVFVLVFNSINTAYANTAVNYYTSIASTVYDVATGNLTTNYEVGKAVNDGSIAANDRRYVTKTTKPNNIVSRLKHIATKGNTLGLAITAAVAAAGWAITEIKQDLYGNDQAEFTKTTYGTVYQVTIGALKSGWVGSPSEALSITEGMYNDAWGPNITISTTLLSSTTFEWTQYQGNNENGPFLSTIAVKQGQNEEVLGDFDLQRIAEDTYTPAQYNELYEVPDYIPNTIQEEKELQVNVIQEAFPEELPSYVDANSVTSMTVVPGTAPEIKEIQIDEALTDTTPEETPDTYADPWEEFLPDGSPNPNYDPRTDTNSPNYDPNYDPRTKEEVDPKQAEREKEMVELLKNIKDQQAEQLKEQQELQEQAKNLNKESTQKRIEENTKTIKDVLAEINARDKKKEEEEEEQEDYDPEKSVFNTDIETPDRKTFDTQLITDFKDDIGMLNNMSATGSCSMQFYNPYTGSNINVDAFCQNQNTFTAIGNLMLAFTALTSLLIVLRV